jgi:hypothetical protein
VTVSDWASWAQVVIALVGIVSLLVSMALSRRALYETRLERQWRLSPFLYFQTGLKGVPVEIVAGAGHAIPGINPESASKLLGHINGIAGSDSILPREPYGELVNVGQGAAVEVTVAWLTERVVTADGTTPDKALLSKRLNVMPAVPRVIRPGEYGQLTRLPSYIVKDIGHNLVEAHGYLEIACKDLGGSHHVRYQSVHLWIDWSREFTPIVDVTFGDQVERPDAAGHDFRRHAQGLRPTAALDAARSRRAPDELGSRSLRSKGDHRANLARRGLQSRMRAWLRRDG